MKRVPRGMAAALVVSLAAHAALLATTWTGAAAGSHVPPLTLMVARLVEVPAPEAVAAPTSDAALAPPVDEATPSAPQTPEADAPTPPASTPEAAAPSKADLPKAVVAPAIPDPSDAASAAVAPTRRAEAGDSGPPTAAADSSGGLDRGPLPLDDIDLESRAAGSSRGGTVTLRLAISDRGVVESVEVVQSSPPGLFDPVALAAAVGRVRFSPALKAGIPVRSDVLYEISVTPLGRGTETSGRTY